MNSHSHSSHNPLRPYYIPPPEVPYESAQPTSSLPTSTSQAVSAASASYGILSDLQQDYSDYLETPSVGEMVQNLLNQAILKYTSILIAQPFEVAKTVLQCQFVPKKEIKPKKTQWPEEDDEDLSDDSDDEPRYFTSNASPDESPSLKPTRGLNGRRRKTTDRTGYVLDDKDDQDIARPDYQIRQIRDGAIGDTLKALWFKEAAWGIWKGQNATFIYTVCASTMESWASSFISAILALPDPGFTEAADSSHPMASLGIAVAASVATALALAPLDIIRTKLILTPSSSKPRLLRTLRTLPSYSIPRELILPTALHALIPSIISLGSPYLIKTKLHLDPIINSTSFSIFSFIASAVELFVKLPLETILRRAQISVAKPERTIVPVGRYAGMVGTTWVLVKEEESGKWGIGGLYRGWRVGAWGNVGVLGLGIVGVQQSQTGEF